MHGCNNRVLNAHPAITLNNLQRLHSFNHAVSQAVSVSFITYKVSYYWRLNRTALTLTVWLGSIIFSTTFRRTHTGSVKTISFFCCIYSFPTVANVVRFINGLKSNSCRAPSTKKKKQQQRQKVTTLTPSQRHRSIQSIVLGTEIPLVTGHEHLMV